MNKFLHIGLAASALIAAAPASAADFVFDTVTAGKVAGSGNGNSFTYTATSGKEVLSVKATAWSLGFDGKYTASELASWGTNGLGVYQPGERTDGAYHQIDNVNGWEFIVLQFDRAVTLNSATLNPYQLADRSYTDSDAFIGWDNVAGAWNQTLTSQSIGALTLDGYFNTDNTKFATNKQTTNLPASITGNMWVIGASVNGPDNLNDAFKLAQLTVTAVPEPATWAMMLVGFGMVGAAARYRRRKAVAAIA
ncbi:PEPxxWA-CTERM sorting domain-containing protein [Sphingomonas sp. KR1UV-12]|uniref:PEPxxWA-CTERM sorting domain-containing protein n=1 Tax=Sphingomonas aurea TaxID=3063994 RepID=A0ABT9ENW8_9SPHN|nr:PEPxxWA-CTERM sorting domain-containing protein [Sphingomonas sp. KR1UV-12]MDP1028654.1 PEPxxWA-CTERM sorting domain-containing protein [Sphingomonas sp. KR1UV-12]